jgi:bifunctional DNA-binding transcriptional regulator/antitoxin component of YhaV-PrlF toxin-antitoxin module
MTFIKIKKVGDELVIALDDSAREMLGAKEGDTLVLTETERGSVELTKPDAVMLERLRRGRAFFNKYRSTFEALAK